MTDVRTIAITGVTGSQGGAAARQLLASGWAVRGLTRNTDGKGAQRARAAGVELIQGDMSDPAALDRLVAGAHGVYSVTDFFQNGLTREVEQGRLVVQAAQRAGVQHFVFPSIALADKRTGVPYFEAKAAIEGEVAAAGVPATILRPVMFMEDLVDTKYAPPMWWGSMRRTVGADKKLCWIAVEDVGAIAARVFAKPQTYVGQAYTIAGDCRSLAEAAEIFKRVTGKRPLAIPAPLWLIRRIVNADIVPMWQWMGRNPVTVDLAPARAILPEIMDMETWLRGRTASPRSPS